MHYIFIIFLLNIQVTTTYQGQLSAWTFSSWRSFISSSFWSDKGSRLLFCLAKMLKTRMGCLGWCVYYEQAETLMHETSDVTVKINQFASVDYFNAFRLRQQPRAMAVLSTCYVSAKLLLHYKILWIKMLHTQIKFVPSWNARL